MLIYPNESTYESSDQHQFRAQSSILIMISKGMIRENDQPDLCVTIRYNQSANAMYCYDDYYEWRFNLLRIPGEQITALMDDLAAQGIVVAFRTIMNDFIKELRLILVPLVHDLVWGSAV